MATAAEVEHWKGQLRDAIGRENKLRRACDEAMRLMHKAEDARATLRAVADGLTWQVEELEDEAERLGRYIAFLEDWVRTASPNVEYADEAMRLKRDELGLEAAE